MASTFAGWSPAAIEFYQGLEADNSKTYWTAHRPVYDEAVLAPMQALLADLAEEKDHPRVELLRNKDLAAWKQWPAIEGRLHTAEAESRIVDVLRASGPLVDWLDENVGATALERRR